MGKQGKLAIIGAGGHAKVIIELLELLGYKELFIVTPEPITHLLNYPVAGNDMCLPELFAAGVTEAVVAIGDNARRLSLAEKLGGLGFTFPALIHPAAWVSKRASLGAGTVVFAQAVVQVDSKVGSHCIINTSGSVDHDCTLQDGVHLGPGARVAGGVRIGQRSLIGIGASVLPNLSIGHRAVVGGGSVVTKSVSDNSTVTGNPARPV